MEDYTKRMHPAFQKMLGSTPTGRLRNSTPEFQKIPDPREIPEPLPTREELEAMGPLVTADYTTLELRILAATPGPIPEWLMGEE